MYTGFTIDYLLNLSYYTSKCVSIWVAFIFYPYYKVEI